jgi:pimeloyl-ACP methyl ester carboxylesterase
VFGSPDGSIVMYFHGVPGAISEAQLFDDPAKANGLKIICQDRFALDANFTKPEYFQTLADDICRLSPGKQVDIVGFSVGAFVALQVWRLIPHQVHSLHLVSPAAPLEGGDFLKEMAGKQVFWLAREWPVLFKLLSYWQCLLARYFPNSLFEMLFASAVAGDKTLATNTDFKKSINGVLKECFCNNAAGYLRDVLAYVAPWQDTLSKVAVKTHLWHGDQDNWSPCAMSAYLKQQIPAYADIHLQEGLSHYSCLYAAVPTICELLRHSEQD